MGEELNYDLKSRSPDRILEAPQLPYQPRVSPSYRPGIGLIGCGGITKTHLEAYRKAGWRVVALCDLDSARAEERRKAFYPEARVYSDYRQLLRQEDVEVVDATLHPGPRATAIEQALLAGKHVLSQKPFVLDLEVGRKLIDLAERRELKLAVNQNGRWAPYVRYIQLAIDRGLIGVPQSVSIHCAWDHTWIKGTLFENLHHIILYDFAVHWVDMVCCFINRSPLMASAMVRQVSGQKIRPPLLASCQLGFDGALANLFFDATVEVGGHETVTVTGSKGKLVASGDVTRAHDLSLHTPEGIARPGLDGNWFCDGFIGAMGELICAIEEDREPFHSAANNLRTLEAVFALVASADQGAYVVPGSITALGDSCKVMDPQ